MSVLVSACQPKTIRNTPVLVYYSVRGRRTQHGPQGHLSKSMLERMHYRIWGYNFGEGWKKQGFTPDWLLSGSGDNCTIGYFNKFCWEGGKTSSRLRLWLVKKQQSLRVAKISGCLVIFVVRPCPCLCWYSDVIKSDLILCWTSSS